ncbi:hypothetical protein Tco_1411140 [Tanacetum coccineum]
MDLNKFVVKADMINYVLHKYGSNWQVHDAIADDILDDLLKKEWEKQKRVKYDKRKVTEMKILDILKQRIEKVRKHLNKAKQIMDINKGKEKMVIERAVIINLFKLPLMKALIITLLKLPPMKALIITLFKLPPMKAPIITLFKLPLMKALIIPFQATFDDSSNDTLKSSSEDTCSSDSTWEQKKPLKVNQGLDLPKRKKAFDGKQGSSSAKAKKATIPSDNVQWYDDLSLDEQRIVYKGRRGSSFRNAAIKKPEKPKSKSKHLAPTTPRTWSTYTTLVIPTKGHLQ